MWDFVFIYNCTYVHIYFFYITYIVLALTYFLFSNNYVLWLDLITCTPLIVNNEIVWGMCILVGHHNCQVIDVYWCFNIDFHKRISIVDFFLSKRCCLKGNFIMTTYISAIVFIRTFFWWYSDKYIKMKYKVAFTIVHLE